MRNGTGFALLAMLPLRRGWVPVEVALAVGKPLAYTVSVKVAWDAIKNLANQRKHGVSFEEAQELFLSGRDYLEIFDDAHSDLEDRFIAVGPIARGLVLVVWTEHDEDTVRIISAR